MKSKYYFPHTATVFFLLTVAVALFSWIGSIYGLGKVQSLLSPEGIRWELRHAMGNFVQTPALGIVMMLFLGFGITVHSGVWGTLGRIVKRGSPFPVRKACVDIGRLYAACLYHNDYWHHFCPMDYVA